MLNIPNNEELSEIQKLRVQREFLQSQKEHFEGMRFTDPPGVYGTAASRNSDARWQARRLGEKISDIDHRIALLEKLGKGV